MPRVELFESVASTMDVAHRLAGEGAPAGTVVLADRQTAGRGRAGKSWVSAQGAGIWLTMIERPLSSSGLEVLSLRAGLALAEALDRFAPEPIRLKWPNDLYVEGGKLGGILVEARWREQSVEWVAIGVGVNVRQPEDVPEARALDPGTSRLAVLPEMVQAVHSAAASTGPLDRQEIEAFNARDLARGRLCREPGLGRVAGISPSGELLIALADAVAPFRSGSLVLEGESEGEGESERESEGEWEGEGEGQPR
ncbi:MAG TPA: biotin--[acetyl-CoA-carboxylase] ligase [Gemmatimonadaceae bacterium]|nr:biotin--[acetyl-CoA-carboxylase] ligase [Gemmatimonadaceae bacterium]